MYLYDLWLGWTNESYLIRFIKPVKKIQKLNDSLTDWIGWRGSWFNDSLN